jgi:hypothetical protein
MKNEAAAGLCLFHVGQVTIRKIFGKNEGFCRPETVFSGKSSKQRPHAARTFIKGFFLAGPCAEVTAPGNFDQ